MAKDESKDKIVNAIDNLRESFESNALDSKSVLKSL